MRPLPPSCQPSCDSQGLDDVTSRASALPRRLRFHRDCWHFGIGRHPYSLHCSPLSPQDKLVIIDQAVYRSGVRCPCVDLSDELDSLAEDSARSRDFLWIGLKDPTLAEFDVVKDELGLHPLAIEDSVRGQQRPKVELYDGSLFVVMKPLHYTFEDSQVETGELMIFLGDRFIVTVRRGQIAPLTDIRATLEAHPEQLSHGAAGVLYAVLDSVVDNYLASIPSTAARSNFAPGSPGRAKYLLP